MKNQFADFDLKCKVMGIMHNDIKVGNHKYATLDNYCVNQIVKIVSVHDNYCIVERDNNCNDDGWPKGKQWRIKNEDFCD